MTESEFLTELCKRYKFQNIFHPLDEMRAYIAENGYSSTVLGPADHNIDDDGTRVNVLMDSNNIIIGFSVG